MLTKLQKLIFILLLIFLPSQLGLHFWPEWSFINGVRVDYFSPTLYFTDILVLMLLIFNFRLPITNQFEIKKIFNFKTLLVLIFVGLNIYFSFSPFVSFYKWLKVAEFIFLARFVASRAKNKQWPNLDLWLLPPVIYSCILALWQYFNHGSIGGLWYLLGERSFTFDAPGIAPGRPYATFPHPNVLMGFLLVSGSLILTKLTHNSRKITALLFVLLALVCFLTLSKGNFLSGWKLRQQLNNVARQQFNGFPLIGTGLGTSPLYPRNIQNFALLHQPIHNIYLLVLSETGIIGLLTFLFLIIGTLKNSFQTIAKRKSSARSAPFPNFKFQISLFIILILGIFDHYWLTLQQSQLLFAIVVGTLISSHEKTSPQRR